MDDPTWTLLSLLGGAALLGAFVIWWYYRAVIDTKGAFDPTKHEHRAPIDLPHLTDADV